MSVKNKSWPRLARRAGMLHRHLGSLYNSEAKIFWKQIQLMDLRTISHDALFSKFMASWVKVKKWLMMILKTAIESDFLIAARRSEFSSGVNGLLLKIQNILAGYASN